MLFLHRVLINDASTQEILMIIVVTLCPAGT